MSNLEPIRERLVDEQMRNLKRNWLYEDVKLIGPVVVELEPLVGPAEFMLFNQCDTAVAESKRNIEALSEVAPADLPPIAVENKGTYLFISDGNHRALALWRRGIKRTIALLIEPRSR